jgi:ABC-2 type transport system ATP-binding protein
LLREEPGVDRTILRAERISLARGRRRIYEDLNLSFGQGITAILGPNGAGKTTLLEGLLRPGDLGGGSLSLDGEYVPHDLSVSAFLKQVGHMPQDWRFFTPFTVQESVQYVAWLKQLPRASVEEAVVRVLRATDLLEQREAKIRKLSGGMRQRVGLAEAFVNNPRLVLLDEPTVGLDPGQRALFRQYVRAQANDRAVVLSTHLTDDVDAIADRVLVVSDGTVLFDGSPTSLAELGAGATGMTPLEAGYLSVVGHEAHSGVV